MKKRKQLRGTFLKKKNCVNTLVFEYYNIILNIRLRFIVI